MKRQQFLHQVSKFLSYSYEYLFYFKMKQSMKRLQQTMYDIFYFLLYSSYYFRLELLHPKYKICEDCIILIDFIFPFFFVLLLYRKQKQILYIYFSFVQYVPFGFYFQCLFHLSLLFMQFSVYFTCIYTYCD